MLFNSPRALFFRQNTTYDKQYKSQHKSQGREIKGKRHIVGKQPTQLFQLFMHAMCMYLSSMYGVDGLMNLNILISARDSS